MLASCLEKTSAVTCAWDAFWIILGQGFFRYLIFAGLAYLLINVTLAGLLASRKIRAASPGKRQIVREFLASMRTVLVFSGYGLFIGLCIYFDIIVVHQDPALYGWPHLGLNIVLLILGHDAWIYWTHRFMHTKRFYRLIHRLHHRSNNPTPWTSYAFNTGEAIIQGAFLPLALLILPTSLHAAIGFTIASILRNVVAHCGFELYPATKDGRPMFDWLASVTHHDLHHAEPRWNFALYFTIWDRLMGTEHPRYHEEFANAASKEKIRLETT